MRFYGYEAPEAHLIGFHGRNHSGLSLSCTRAMSMSCSGVMQLQDDLRADPLARLGALAHWLAVVGRALAEPLLAVLLRQPLERRERLRAALAGGRLRAPFIAAQPLPRVLCHRAVVVPRRRPLLAAAALVLVRLLVVRAGALLPRRRRRRRAVRLAAATRSLQLVIIRVQLIVLGSLSR